MAKVLDSQPKTGELSSLDSATLLLIECQRDPLFFAREVLGMTLTDDQEAVLLAIRDNKRVVVRSCNNVGKTCVGAIAVLWFGFCFQPCKIITTATVARQVKAQVWSEIHRHYHSAQYELGGELKVQEWRIAADSFAIGFSTDKTDRFQGWHAEHLLFVLDEASGLAATIFEGAEGSMGGHHARLLVLGNPLRPEGEFHKCFTTPGWTCLKMAAERHPNIIEGREVIPGGITREWIENRRAAWGVESPQYVARVKGDFPESSEDVLVPLVWVEEARKRQAPVEQTGDLRMGVDIARYGSDLSVAIIRDDRTIRHMAQWAKRSTMETVGKVKVLGEKWKVGPEQIRIDDTGVGGGVTDRLTEQGWKVVPVNNGEKATDSERFANVRAESYWEMREALNPESQHAFCIPAERAYDVLSAELVQPQYKFTSKGQIVLERKEDIKRRLGNSPDHADALALTFYRVARRRNPSITWI